ncbi:PIR Superfamily Protein [Plasmodium ovale curtisi]|uniref:PIR Superfamily Protein n=1 Tax=Plasmodium ovale curtisi TaxID=864141 RepID=A0A1A8X9Q1_PLAOA|nr:PIR Superfamily Protein [Plasmodium ovale curtisi]SBT01348.1 PIR Superfamily Protein [Plasmodium ovale curtisi]
MEFNFKNEFKANVKISTAECHSEIENLLSYADKSNRLLAKLEQGIASMQKQTGKLERQLESGGPSVPKKGDLIVDIPEENHIFLSSFGTTLPITLFNSGVAALLIFLSVYAFTPLRQWLKLQTQKFGGIKYNFDEEEFEMQQRIAQYDKRKSEHNEYNVAYNSLLNS